MTLELSRVRWLAGFGVFETEMPESVFVAIWMVPASAAERTTILEVIITILIPKQFL